MTDGDSAEVAGGNSAEDAAWRDLIDRFDAPAFTGDAPAPWPAIEDLGGRGSGEGAGTGSAGARNTGTAEDSGTIEATGIAETTGAAEATGTVETTGMGGATGMARAAADDRPAPAAPVHPPLSLPGATDADPLEDEHFIPPPAPPLNLDPATKAAWAGLFGGPGYLIVATIAGWSVPGWAAFCAVAAFIAGFTVLVLRMGDDSPRDSGSDDGAVV